MPRIKPFDLGKHMRRIREKPAPNPLKMEDLPHLSPGTTLYHRTRLNSTHTAMRAKVNGRFNPGPKHTQGTQAYLPMKAGLRDTFRLDSLNVGEWTQTNPDQDDTAS